MVLVEALDLRRFLCLKIRLTRWPAVATDPEADDSESDELDELELSDEDGEFIMLCSIPGCDSSSMTSCGVLSYM